MLSLLAPGPKVYTLVLVPASAITADEGGDVVLPAANKAAAAALVKRDCNSSNDMREAVRLFFDLIAHAQ